ncbi:uncharacterized protein LOC111094597 isoform X3 [Canis lupus familiaris]|uniref:uncharacterized protein LOC111094597 isoform X3 n=3 Tax=Canis lupus TaxID=9612 RepID=UPI0015F188EE|nr:uncharacterized protein LOC111094597 isoform X3 [Canis lupus familiaris]
MGSSVWKTTQCKHPAMTSELLTSSLPSNWFFTFLEAPGWPSPEKSLTNGTLSKEHARRIGPSQHPIQLLQWTVGYPKPFTELFDLQNSPEQVLHLRDSFPWVRAYQRWLTRADGAHLFLPPCLAKSRWLLEISHEKRSILQFLHSSENCQKGKKSSLENKLESRNTRHLPGEDTNAIITSLNNGTSSTTFGMHQLAPAAFPTGLHCLSCILSPLGAYDLLSINHSAPP